MNYVLTDFLQVIGSIGVFIYGMKIMSEGLQKAAGKNLRHILQSMTNNRLSGIFTGLLTTMTIQSSSATTVMVVSFVNAGLLTFAGAIGVIMGANIGTTITAWLTLFSFKIEIQPIAIALIGIFFPFLFSSNEKWRNIAEFVMGFGILFLGLELLKDSFPNIGENAEMLAFLNNFTHSGFLSTLIFVGAGAFLTIVLQSSSASITLTMVMVAQGWIDFPLAAAMVLGENIGTTITANIAATVCNIHARRAARFHLIFNVIGVSSALLVFPLFLGWIDLLHFYIFGANIVNSSASVTENLMHATTGITLFHTAFNISNVLLQVGFVPLLARLIVYLMPEKGNTTYSLKYIKSGYIPISELSINEALMEVQEFGKLVEKMSGNIQSLLFQKVKRPKKLMEKLKQREEATDLLQEKISDFLAQIGTGDISSQTSLRIRAMLKIVNDLERMGDIFYQMTLQLESMEKRDLQFPEEFLLKIKTLLELVHTAIKQMNTNIGLSPNEIDTEEVYAQENQINQLRDELVVAYYKRVEKAHYGVRESIAFLNCVNDAEKVGDHVVNVTEAIAELK
ncbi:MAG: Na/Pi cotransporter family protein [Chitinophagales bacterium]